MNWASARSPRSNIKSHQLEISSLYDDKKTLVGMFRKIIALCMKSECQQ